MTKYLKLLELSWQNGFVYRTSVILWRLRQFLSSLMALTIWTVIYTNQSSVFAYDQSQMINYVFLISVLQSLILSTALNGLANDIYSGTLSQLLIKPVNVLGYLASQDLADKIKNLFFSVAEVGILALIFLPQLPTPSLLQAGLTLLGVLLGLALYFVIMLLFGTIGFWAPETWGPRFLFFMFLDFTAGKLFPLDILPEVIQKIIYWTPFPYLSYVQIQILLGRFSIQESLAALAGASLWVIGLSLCFRFVWKKGIKEYAAAGI